MNTLRHSQFLFSQFNKLASPVFQQSLRCVNDIAQLHLNNETKIYTLKMNNPPVNALNTKMLSSLHDAMEKVEKENGAGLILTSGIPGIFTAGLDLRELYKTDEEKLKKFWVSLQNMWLKLFGAPYFTVAAINGAAPGAGCLMACSCDYRVMQRGSNTIGLNETQFGLSPPIWFMDTFRNVLTSRQAELACLSGKLFSVEEAAKVELIDEVGKDSEEVVQKSEEFLKKIFKVNRYAAMYVKSVTREPIIKKFSDSRKNDLSFTVKFIMSPEVQNALGIYAQKLQGKK